MPLEMANGASVIESLVAHPVKLENFLEAHGLSPFLYRLSHPVSRGSAVLGRPGHRTHCDHYLRRGLLCFKCSEWLVITYECTFQARHSLQGRYKTVEVRFELVEILQLPEVD